MSVKVRAYYLNGVFTPLEPLDLEEGAVVELSLNADLALYPKDKPEKAEFRVKPNHSAFLPGMDDPKRMKQLLEDEDIEHFLRVQEFGKGT